MSARICSRNRQGKLVAHTSYDNRKMAEFLYAQSDNDAMGFYDQRDLPNCCARVRHSTLRGRYFFSFSGPSPRNHLCPVAQFPAPTS